MNFHLTVLFKMEQIKEIKEKILHLEEMIQCLEEKANDESDHDEKMALLKGVKKCHNKIGRHLKEIIKLYEGLVSIEDYESGLASGGFSKNEL